MYAQKIKKKKMSADKGSTIEWKSLSLTIFKLNIEAHQHSYYIMLVKCYFSFAVLGHAKLIASK